MFGIKVDSEAITSSLLTFSFGIISIVSSPATVPKMYFEALLSISPAIAIAYPGRVLIIASCPENSIPTKPKDESGDSSGVVTFASDN